MDKTEEIKEMTLSDLTDFINKQNEDVVINIDFGEYLDNKRQA